MFFRLPHPPLCFEIPDEWLAAAGASGFKPSAPSYRFSGYLAESETLVPLDEVAPMLRRPGVNRDHRGFRREGGFDGSGCGGMTHVLQAIVGGTHLPPASIRAARGESGEGFKYVVLDGFHRFYASIALGFTHLPCEVRADWRGEAQFGDDDLR